MGIQVLIASTSQFRRYDKYVAEGSLEDGLEMSLVEGRRVEFRLKELLVANENGVGDGDGEVQINITSLLKGKEVATEARA